MYWLWGVMIAYGVVMYVLSPRARTPGQFYAALDRSGREVGLGLLVGSVAITWLFAKSITNAANLGADFGIVGAEILSATTISGTMVLGLAPIFVLHRVDSAGPWAFHLAFWPAVAIGVAHAAGWSPQWLVIGEGTYGSLLGVNVAVTALVVAGFFVGALLDRR